MTQPTDPSTPDPWADDPSATQRTALPSPAEPQVADPIPDRGQHGGDAPDRGRDQRDGDRDRRDDGRAGSIVFGLALLGVGTWFFLEQTLGLDLPDLRWDELWPLILIGIGAWIVVGAMRRGGD